MKKGLLVLTALVAFVFALPTLSEAKIEITGAALVSAQNVDFDSTTGNQDEDFNFNDPRVNLYINGDVSDKISFNTVIWLANEWSSENQRAGATGATASGLANFGNVALLEGSLTLKDVMGSGFNLKVGTIAIPYGWEYTTRTNNGDNGKNDFISNSLLDINGRDEGISLSGSFDMGQTSTPLSWEIALLNGGVVTDGNPAGVAGAAAIGGGDRSKSNHDLAWAIRAEAGLQENFTLQASYYKNDEKADGTNDPLNIGSSFFVNSVSRSNPGTARNANLNGLVYTGSEAKNVAGGTNSSGRQDDRNMWEVSGKYDYGQGNLTAFYGAISSDSASSVQGDGNRDWKYYGGQGRYNFDDHSYLAVRWNKLNVDYTPAAGLQLGDPSMWTVAAGYKLADNATVKAEWSSFDEGGKDFGYVDPTGVLQNTAASAANNGSQDATALTVAVGVSF